MIESHLEVASKLVLTCVCVLAYLQSGVVVLNIVS